MTCDVGRVILHHVPDALCVTETDTKTKATGLNRVSRDFSLKVSQFCSVVDSQDTTSVLMELGDSARSPVVNVYSASQFTDASRCICFNPCVRVSRVDFRPRSFKTLTPTPLLPAAVELATVGSGSDGS